MGGEGGVGGVASGISRVPRVCAVRDNYINITPPLHPLHPYKNSIYSKINSDLKERHLAPVPTASTSASNVIYDPFRWYFREVKYHRNDRKMTFGRVKSTPGTNPKWRTFAVWQRNLIISNRAEAWLLQHGMSLTVLMSCDVIFLKSIKNNTFLMIYLQNGILFITFAPT